MEISEVYSSISGEFLRNANKVLQMRYTRSVDFYLKQMRNSSLPSLIGWFVGYLVSRLSTVSI
jgi:hypothetical protein